MKYNSEMTINLGRDRVVELFQDEAFTHIWQPSLEKIEQVGGERGQDGSVYNLHYDRDGRKMILKETIISNNLPDGFTATYDASGVHNIVQNRFYDTGDGQTRWVMENEFRFSGLMRIISLFIRGRFASNTQDSMQTFKTAAESHGQAG